MTPTPPPVVVAAPAPPAPRPAVVAIGVVCSSMPAPPMPAKASREGLSGTVRARATIKGGKVVAVEILSASPRGVFEETVKKAMLQYGCQAGDEEIKADQTFEFKIAE
jgi:periplasmic protein TonB